MDVVDRLTTTQHSLEKVRAKVQKKASKEHMEYLRGLDRKAQKLGKSMVNVFIELKHGHVPRLHTRSRTHPSTCNLVTVI